MEVGWHFFGELRKGELPKGWCVFTPLLPIMKSDPYV